MPIGKNISNHNNAWVHIIGIPGTCLRIEVNSGGASPFSEFYKDKFLKLTSKGCTLTELNMKPNRLSIQDTTSLKVSEAFRGRVRGMQILEG